jgi:hypothetical protein
MTFSSEDLINILKNPITPYPYSFTFFNQEQKFPVYPSCEVIKTSTESHTTDVTKTSIDVTFEIRFLIKYTRRPEFEEKDREIIEKIMTDTLEAYDFLPTQKIYFETKTWSHRVVDAEIRGSISTLRFKYTEIVSSSGSGFVGSSTVLELNSQTTPKQIKVLNFTFFEGVSVDKHQNDNGVIAYDPSIAGEGEITVTYENTAEIDDLIKTLTDLREEHNGKFIHGGITKQYIFLFGKTVKSNAYADIEKATTTLYVQGTWV